MRFRFCGSRNHLPSQFFLLNSPQVYPPNLLLPAQSTDSLSVFLFSFVHFFVVRSENIEFGLYLNGLFQMYQSIFQLSTLFVVNSQVVMTGAETLVIPVLLD